MTAFLEPPPSPSPAAQRLYNEDVEELGFVMNVSRLWAHQPDAFAAFVEVLTSCVKAGGLTVRDRGILVTACASTVGDSYCSLMWGKKLAAASDVETAASVLLAITVFVGFRLGFSAVNDALGALPDAPLRGLIPRPIVDAVTYGRPYDDEA